MSKLVWDQSGARYYETGVKNAALYVYDTTNSRYGLGVAWNGITAVTEKPTGADSNALYADNMKYLNLTAAEDHEATVEAYFYPDEFGECDGTDSPVTGASIGQQPRKMFGLAYRTEIGSDTNDQLGFKIHLLWGAKAAPSEKSYESINDSPDAINFSWDITTTPPTFTYQNVNYTSATMTIDSRSMTALKLAKLFAALYGADAEAYSASSAYAVGDACTHVDGLSTKTYICKTAIPSGEAWNASHWDEIPNPGMLPMPGDVITLLA